jgi:mxaD protein
MLFSLLACSVGAAPDVPVLKVEESIPVAAKPAVVWQLIGDFRGLPQRHPAVSSTEIVKGKNNARGAVRSIDTKDGVRLTEELLAYDGRRHSMRYRIIESPLPVSGYVSTPRVNPEGTGSRIVWKSEFRRAGPADVDDTKARDIIAGIYRAGFDGVRARLGDTATGR